MSSSQATKIEVKELKTNVQGTLKKSVNDASGIAGVHKDPKRGRKLRDSSPSGVDLRALRVHERLDIHRRCSEGNLSKDYKNGFLVEMEPLENYTKRREKVVSERKPDVNRGLSLDVESDGFLESRARRQKYRKDRSRSVYYADFLSDQFDGQNKQPSRSQSSSSRKSTVLFDLGEAEQDSSQSSSNDPERRCVRKNSKRRRSSIQPGVVLDVSGLQKENGKQKEEKDSLSVHGIPSSSSRPSAPRLTFSVDKDLLNPTNYAAGSPSPSQVSTESNGYESACSSLYHSSNLFPPDFNLNPGGPMQRSRSNQDTRRLSTPAVLPHRSYSSQIPVGAPHSAPQSVRSSPRHTSNEEENRATPPYVRINDGVFKGVPRYEGNRPGGEAESTSLICHSTLGNICGMEGTEEKEISDQTCRSNFGMVLSGICFVLFLWYLAVVYKSFLDKALSFETYEGLYTPTLSPVQEVVIHIAMDDMSIVP